MNKEEEKQELKRFKSNSTIVEMLIDAAQTIPSKKVVVLLVLDKEDEGVRFEVKFVRAFSNDDVMSEVEKYIVGLGNPTNYQVDYIG